MRWLGLIAALWILPGCSEEPGAPIVDPELPAETAEVDPTLVAIDLGVHAVGSEVVFEVPAATLGATLVGRARGDFGFESLQAGEVDIVSEYGFDGLQRFVSTRPRVGDREVSMLAMALPQSDSGLPLAHGAHRLVLGAAGDNAASEVSLTVWLRSQTSPGAFDVRVFAAEGVADAAYLGDLVAKALDGFAGMSLGAVSFHTLPETALVLDDDAELLEVLAMTEGQDGVPSVNIVATSDMSGLLGSPVGRAGGIPAIGAEHGTELSGLAFEVSGELGRDVEVVRHEVGHLAGLFHTTDAYGADPLADTPSCADVDAEGCPDEGNVMFPRSLVPRATLSDTQRRIVLGSTLYRAARGAPPPPLWTTPARSRIRLPAGLEDLGAICGVDSSRMSAEALLAVAGDERFPAYLRKRAAMLAHEIPRR